MMQKRLKEWINISKSNLSDNLLGSKKDKTVETKDLLVRGNQLQWEGMLIQISNISLITTSNVNAPAFPIWAAVAAVIGVAMFSNFSELWFLSVILLISSGLAIYNWFRKNEASKHRKYLNILLNSGQTYSILFNDEKFLNKVFQTFSNIFDEDKSSEISYHIDLTNCTIDNKSSVVSTVR